MFLPHGRICSEPLNELMGMDHAISIPISLLKPILSTPLRNTKHSRQKNRHFIFWHDTISWRGLLAMDPSDLSIPPQCAKNTKNAAHVTSRQPSLLSYCLELHQNASIISQWLRQWVMSCFRGCVIRIPNPAKWIYMNLIVGPEQSIGTSWI